MRMARMLIAMPLRATDADLRRRQVPYEVFVWN